MYERSLRLWALSRGFHLSNYALEHIRTGERVACTTEADIFRALDLCYRPPEHRCA